jgi:nitrite reductase/ring-hydroxylating ferredoxin subunit
MGSEEIAMAAHWVSAVDRAKLEKDGRAVVRLEGKQIALFRTADGIFACNNRCPHEGYPLREGSLDDQCRLTCNWHNWKFDLKTGANAYGLGERLRVYPVELRGEAIWLDIADPPFEERRSELMTNLREAFNDNDYERMAREIARLKLLGADPVEAVRAAIDWSWNRFEFGWTHAYAGAADWLALYDRRQGEDETQLICLVEIVGHIADDILREPVYPFSDAAVAWSEQEFLAAIEAEDETAAISRLNGAFAAGLGWPALERAFATAALAHYNGFGHSIIYVTKAGRLIERLGASVMPPLLRSLVREFIFTTREEYLPEFRSYETALAGWGKGANGKTLTVADLAGLNASKAMATLSAHGTEPPEQLYRAVLGMSAHALLHFDLTVMNRTDGPIADNASWLDVTHGITFSNAVRTACARYPELWPQALLQVALQAGRNAGFIDPSVETEDWAVRDPESFLADAVDGLFDHAREEFIVSVHLLKTTLAAQEQVVSGAAGAHCEILLAGLNRFLNSPLKRKHARRVAHQAMQFVALDG